MYYEDLVKLGSVILKLCLGFECNTCIMLFYEHDVKADQRVLSWRSLIKRHRLIKGFEYL